MSREKYEKCCSNLPAGTMEVVINGGCHAGFAGWIPPKDVFDEHKLWSATKGLYPIAFETSSLPSSD